MENPPAQDVVFRTTSAPPSSYAGDLAWINDYVGVPYLANGRTRAGWDCWGLVVAVYRERLARELPDWRWSPPFDWKDKAIAFNAAVDSVYSGLLAIELEAPEPMAICLVGSGRSAAAWHVGVSVGGGVLHAQRFGGSVWVPLGRWQRDFPEGRWFRWRR